jgi:hypothetical protein
MAGPERDAIEVRVVRARTEHAAVTFTPGVPTQPFSVGTNAQWSVLGDGVGAIHLFLGFDGQMVHVVAASPGMPVLIGGGSIGAAWVTVPVPCEIHFGGASLMIRRLGVVPANSDVVPSTLSDGGALLQAAQRAAGDASPAPLSRSSPAPRRKAFGSTMLMDQRPSLPAADPPPAIAPMPILERARAPRNELPGEPSPQDAPPSEPTKGYWNSASTVKKATLILMPFALASSYLMLRNDPRGQPTVIAVPPRAPAPRASTNAVSTAPSAEANVRRSAPAVAVSAVAIAAAPSAVDGAQGGARQSPTDGSPASRLAAVFVPARQGRRTPEREALETVAAGSLEDAARDYDSLAVAHPDDPTFKEAARILRAKAGRVH